MKQNSFDCVSSYKVDHSPSSCSITLTSSLRYTNYKLKVGMTEDVPKQIGVLPTTREVYLFSTLGIIRNINVHFSCIICFLPANARERGDYNASGSCAWCGNPGGGSDSLASADHKRSFQNDLFGIFPWKVGGIPLHTWPDIRQCQIENRLAISHMPPIL